MDDSDEIVCRMDVRQCDKSKITIATTDCLLIAQGNQATDEKTILAAMDRVVELAGQFCGGVAVYGSMANRI